MATGQPLGAILVPLIVMPEDMNECWLWQGSINPKTGYGKKQFGGKSILAHRWVFENFCGQIPEGLVIDHLCRHRSCVNPKHMRVVTPAENSRAGTNARLTEEQVREIRRRLTDEPRWGCVGRLADEFGVARQTISSIKRRQSWKDIET